MASDFLAWLVALVAFAGKSLKKSVFGLKSINKGSTHLNFLRPSSSKIDELAESAGKIDDVKNGNLPFNNNINSACNTTSTKFTKNLLDVNTHTKFPFYRRWLHCSNDALLYGAFYVIWGQLLPLSRIRHSIVGDLTRRLFRSLCAVGWRATHSSEVKNPYISSISNCNNILPQTMSDNQCCIGTSLVSSSILRLGKLTTSSTSSSSSSTSTNNNNNQVLSLMVNWSLTRRIGDFECSRAKSFHHRAADSARPPESETSGELEKEADHDMNQHHQHHHHHHHNRDYTLSADYLCSPMPNDCYFRVWVDVPDPELVRMMIARKLYESERCIFEDDCQKKPWAPCDGPF